jgi:hypothetical protein
MHDGRIDTDDVEQQKLNPMVVDLKSLSFVEEGASYSFPFSLSRMASFLDSASVNQIKNGAPKFAVTLPSSKNTSPLLLISVTNRCSAVNPISSSLIVVITAITDDGPSDYSLIFNCRPREWIVGARAPHRPIAQFF